MSVSFWGRQRKSLNIRSWKKEKLLLEDAQNISLRQQVEYIKSFLDEQDSRITEYDETLVRKLIEKITVYEDHLLFEFKSGLEAEIEM